MNCPTCGHAVKVVGDTTQHYEPIGCLQLVDDHELCERETATLRAALERIAHLDFRGYPHESARIASEALNDA